ncbi:hypothetical protein [Deinococcus rufus]|uniref:PKD domain-containing protein n=1 Tax=Deinococcus rufus TaxID=2136097 RepID=A0ABV7Z7W8_9DEIO
MSADTVLARINAALARAGIAAALSLGAAGSAAPVPVPGVTTLAASLTLTLPLPEGLIVVAAGGAAPTPAGPDLELSSATVVTGSTVSAETARVPEGGVIVWGDGTQGGTEHVYTVPGTYSVRVEVDGAVLRSTIRTLTVLGPHGLPEWFTAPFQAPLVITEGGVYSGNYRSNDWRVPAVQIKTREAVFLGKMRLEGRGVLVECAYEDVTLTMRNVYGVGLNPNEAGRRHGRFVNCEDFVSVDIENCYCEKTSGIYFRSWTGRAAQGTPTINVQKVRAKNIEGRLSDGAGGYSAGFYRVQFLQINAIANIPRVKIKWNSVLNEARNSRVEDNINLGGSSGTEDSWIEIAYNLIDGAYDAVPGARYTGGGILIGDGAGGQNIHVHHNAVVQSSNYSVANAGAHRNVLFEDNRWASTGRLADGTLVNTINDNGGYNRNYARALNWQPASVIWRRNIAAHGKPTASNPNRRGDYSLNAPTLSTSIDNTSLNGGVGAVTDADVQAVRDWHAGLVAAGNVTIGLAA